MLRRRYPRLAALHQVTAFIVFNTLALLVVFNLALAGYLRLRTPRVPPEIAERHQFFDDPRAYTRVSGSDFQRLMQEQFLYEGLRYAPWVQFVSVPFRGHLLNVDDRGFRRTLSPHRSSPASPSIFVLGGSTTFGFGVPDVYTIPSCLQRILEKEHPVGTVVVKNLGQPYYYSSQELTLLTVLLRTGEIPKAAVFIDGLNDTLFLSRHVDEPYFTSRVRELWDNSARPMPPRRFAAWEWLPMVRLAEEWTPRRAPEPRRPMSARIDDGRTFAPAEAQRISEYVVAHYTANVRMLDGMCQAYGMECLFLWQPCPFYKYDRSLHRRFPYHAEIPGYWPEVYNRMSRFSHPRFLFLGDLFENTTTRIYVDDVHYNEAASELIASRIAERLSLARTGPGP